MRRLNDCFCNFCWVILNMWKCFIFRGPISFDHNFWNIWPFLLFFFLKCSKFSLECARKMREYYRARNRARIRAIALNHARDHCAITAYLPSKISPHISWSFDRENSVKPTRNPNFTSVLKFNQSKWLKIYLKIIFKFKIRISHTFYTKKKVYLGIFFFEEGVRLFEGGFSASASPRFLGKFQMCFFAKCVFLQKFCDRILDSY